MRVIFRQLWMVAVLATALSLSALTPVSADENYFPTGEDWLASPLDVKRAYVLGISNMMTAEHSFQQASGNPPSSKRSVIGTMYRATRGVSVDTAISEIDSFYQNNPQAQNQTVLEVIWDNIVRRTK